MKALLYTAPYTLSHEEVPVPQLAESDVLVRVRTVGICGSDVLGYTGTTGRRIPPLIMGHEAAGIVAEVGRGVKSIPVGQRVCFDSTVFCNACVACTNKMFNRCLRREVLGVSVPGMKRHGAMAEFVRLPAHALHAMPESLSFRHAAMLEPLAIGLHAVSRGPGLANSRILIIGAGTIGLCVLQAVCLQNPRQVIVTDLSAHRLEVARDLGADVAEEPHDYSYEADVTFEVVGIAPTIDAAIQGTKSGGCVVLVGNAAQCPPVDIQAVVAKELTLTGTYASGGEYAEALARLSCGELNPEPLISGEMPLQDGAEAFARLEKRTDPGLIKVLLKP